MAAPTPVKASCIANISVPALGVDGPHRQRAYACRYRGLSQHTLGSTTRDLYPQGARKRKRSPLPSLIHLRFWVIGPVRHPCTSPGTKQQCGLCTGNGAATRATYFAEPTRFGNEVVNLSTGTTNSLSRIERHDSQCSIDCNLGDLCLPLRDMITYGIFNIRDAVRW
jgi:hypothetical protein